MGTAVPLDLVGARLTHEEALPDGPPSARIGVGITVPEGTVRRSGSARCRRHDRRQSTSRAKHNLRDTTEDVQRRPGPKAEP